MSRTALDVIKKSLRELGILQTQEEPDAAEAQDALDVLNGLLIAWELEGIKLNHVDMVLTDALPYPDNHYLPVAYNLAMELAGEYEINIRGDLASKAENGYRNLQNYYHDPAPMQFDDALHPLYSPNRYYS